MIQPYKLLRSQCEDPRPISGPAGPATRIDNDERPGLDRFQSKSRCMASHTSDISHCSTARTCCSWSSPLIVALLICCAREGRQPGKGEAVSYFHCIITAVKQAPPPQFTVHYHPCCLHCCCLAGPVRWQGWSQRPTRWHGHSLPCLAGTCVTV